MFVVGYLVHALAQIDAAARAKNNAITSRMRIIDLNWIRLLSRFFFSLMIFLGVWANPTVLSTLAGYFGVTLSQNAIAIMTLPMSVWTAGLWGFGIDSALAFVPVLKNALPPIEGLQGLLLEDAAHHIAAAKEDVEQAKVTDAKPPAQNGAAKL